jgi:hypothetical protein
VPAPTILDKATIIADEYSRLATSSEREAAVISILAEGGSIRAIERITGVNKNTIMSLMPG